MASATREAPTVSDAEREAQMLEWLTCSESPAYFIHSHVQILSGDRWVPFRLWPAQVRTLRVIATERRVIILKARQLGLTWLVLGYLLWLMLFRPAAGVSLFSLRDNEAVELLDKRLKRMHTRLPAYLRAERVIQDDKHVWELSQGSVARAFPTSAGDSYTARCALIDEADLVPDLGDALGRVEPTVSHAEGQLILLSRTNKKLPVSRFKAIYAEAVRGTTEWAPVFLPWSARPDRDEAWYATKRQDTLRNTGALDDLHEQYPATAEEALAPRSLDKRLPFEWLQGCYGAGAAIDAPGAPADPELVVYEAPLPGVAYAIGADPAEGLPGGDDSSAHVVRVDTGAEVAKLVGKLEPKRAFPAALARLSTWYNGARVLVERNNHGHAVIAGLEAARASVLAGRDGRPGWAESALAKSLLYDTAADQFKNNEALVRSFSTLQQLQSIERNTLSAPKGLHDDEAVSFALALMARAIQPAVFRARVI